MKKIAFSLVVLGVGFSFPAFSESLKEISSFSKETCDKIETEGEITRNEIITKLDAEAKGVAKLLGLSVAADGSLIRGTTKYKGISYEKLPEQMTDARACRKELSIMLLEERRQIAKVNDETKKKLTD